MKDEEAERRANWMFLDLGLVATGLILIFSSVFFDFFWGWILFVGGTCIAGLSLTEIGIILYGLSKHFAEKIELLQKNRSGAIWIWAVCLLAIVTLAIGWFAFTWPANLIIDYIVGQYTFPSQQQTAITLMRNVMGWFLILMLLGLLLWAYVHSQRREEVTYPI